MLTTIGLSDEYAPLIASGILTLGDLAIGRGYANVGSAFAKGVKSEVRGGTYVLRNEYDNVVRSGRTNNLARRQIEHARDPILKDYTFEAVHRTDVYTKQRGLEQILHDAYNPPLNKIKPISSKNPNKSTYKIAAEEFITGGK